MITAAAVVGIVVGDGASNWCSAGTSVASIAAAGTGNDAGAVVAIGVAGAATTPASGLVSVTDADADADVDDLDDAAAPNDNNGADTVDVADALLVRPPGSYSSSSSSEWCPKENSSFEV